MKKSILFFLLAIGLGIRIYGIAFEKKWFSHDESVTYMSAAAKQGAFENSWSNTSSANFSTAQKWKAFYATENFWNFKQISTDLALTDIHPPLFFWLLHILTYFIGVQPYTGLLLNLVLSLLLLLATFKLAKYVLTDSTAALLAASLWFLSPAVNQIDFEARHYQLLGLVSVLFINCTLKLIFSTETVSKKRQYSYLFLLTTAGLLSHYYFSFIVVGAMLIFVLRYRLHKITFHYFTVLLGGLLAFLIVFPQFFDFILKMKSNLENGGERDGTVVTKLQTMFMFSADFFAYGKAGKLLLFAFLCLCFYAILQKLKRAKFYFFNTNSSTEKQLYLLYFLSWNVFFTALFYILKVSPGQAVGEQYYSYIWPLLAVALVLLFRVYKLKSIYGYLLVCVFLISSFFSMRNSTYLKLEFPLAWFSIANQSELLILNNNSRGYLPRTSFYLRSDLPVWVGACDAENLTKLKAKYKNICFFSQSEKGNATNELTADFKAMNYTLKALPNTAEPQNTNYRFFVLRCAD